MTPRSAPPPRDHALDALRTLAIVGMMAAHTARLMSPDVRPSWATGVLLIEPVIPSLFLFLVGLSLALSFDGGRRRSEAPRAWYGRQLRRAGGLWLISAVFFSLEIGVRLPDALLAGGILANIAYAIVLVGGLLVLPTARRVRDIGAIARGATLAVALSLGTMLFVWIDVAGLRLHPVNIGNSPFLPLWLFALAGALWVTLTRAGSHADTEPGRARPTVAVVGILGLAAGAVAIALIARYGLDVLFTKPFGRSDATRLVPAPVYGGDPLSLGYYNLRPVLAATCLGLHLAGLVVFGALQNQGRRLAMRETRDSTLLRAGRVITSLFAMGRFALTAYILHLALLATLVVASGERQPLKAGWQGTLTWIALILICQAVSIVRGRHKNVQFGH